MTDPKDQAERAAGADTERAIKASNRAAKMQERADHHEPGPEKNQAEFMAETARHVSRRILGKVAEGGGADG